ncbi:cyclic nucleotide-binding domain-containing protein [Pseudomaricurvus alkylphenolicus]|uniref:cyclic nucleotide-binding domain-containing protein n=1 Tax=Pseudomaricurvus alkylphenolicus TaxID=1306991 RepID=UPI00141EFF5B|nr:cyclic nucleotide-binding domain-containing protein [Pseudomaricurvus alkylphenolicus]NIB40103.1 cyclic nucleotide-binding domain-containing protein [Pseudomaricurvus alkylphenolicus]
MQKDAVNEYPRAAIDRLVGAIPFYKQLQQSDGGQYELLLQHSRVMTYGPGEVVLEQGDAGHWLCFLLKGQLQVLAGEPRQEVNQITPGEVFGDLAMLLKQARTATVVADSLSREAVVFCTDFSLFGELEDFSRVTLATKLIYFRNLVHSLRWKLEVYRSKYASHPLANRHRSVKLYLGSKDTLEELAGMHEQAAQLARLLVEWNQEFGYLSVSQTPAPSPQVLAALGRAG